MLPDVDEPLVVRSGLCSRGGGGLEVGGGGGGGGGDGFEGCFDWRFSGLAFEGMDEPVLDDRDTPLWNGSCHENPSNVTASPSSRYSRPRL